MITWSLAAAILVAATISPVSAQVSPGAVATDTAHSAGSVAMQPAPPRPRYVAGYSAHALQRMAERRISKAEVERLVASPIPGKYQDDNDTWLIMNPVTGLIVVINKNAYIVTGIRGQM
jgi:hypothetical protein